MSGLCIENIRENETPEQGIYLTILHADKIPPHLGLCIDHHFFSLKVSGKEIIPRKNLERAIEFKKIPSIFMRIRSNISPHNISEEAHEIFNTYSKVSLNNSCIDPIKEMMKRFFFIKNTERIKNLHDLLPALQEMKVVKESYAFHLPISKNKTYIIKKYGQEEIETRIKTLGV